MILLLDLDEVVVDFVGGACKVHGITRQQMEHYREPGEWTITKPLGLAKTAGWCGLTQDEFWQPIHDAGVEFWEGLDKLPWFNDVLRWADDNFDQWFFVSSPSRETNSYTGKVNWLKREFGSDFDRFFLTPHKELLARRDRVLLDDRDDNLKNFSKWGGKCILFPTKGGRLHAFADDPMQKLREVSIPTILDPKRSNEL